MTIKVGMLLCTFKGFDMAEVTGHTAWVIDAQTKEFEPDPNRPIKGAYVDYIFTAAVHPPVDDPGIVAELTNGEVEPTDFAPDLIKPRVSIYPCVAPQRQLPTGTKVTGFEINVQARAGHDPATVETTIATALGVLASMAAEVADHDLPLLQPWSRGGYTMLGSEAIRRFNQTEPGDETPPSH